MVKKMVISMVMIKVNVAQAKAHLSHLLRRARAGVQVVICHRNQPVAELRALPGLPTGRRKLGSGPHGVRVPPSFHDPLPEETLSAFEGGDTEPASPGPT